MPQELHRSYKKPPGNRRNKSAGESVHLTGFAGDKTAAAELGVSFPAEGLTFTQRGERNIKRVSLIGHLYTEKGF